MLVAITFKGMGNAIHGSGSPAITLESDAALGAILLTLTAIAPSVGISLATLVALATWLNVGPQSGNKPAPSRANLQY